MASNDIIILVNGLAYEGWLEYTSSHSFDKAAGTLDLKISPQPGVPMPIKIGHKIQAIVGSRPVLTGHVHEVDGDDAWEHDHRTIHARDKTQDFVDSTLGPQKHPPPPASLQKILQQAVSNMGLDFGVVDKAGTEPFEKGEVVSGSVDETGHGFGDRLARQRQALLNTDGKGNLQIDRNKGQMGPGMLFRAPPETQASTRNNILKAKYRNSDLKQHGQNAVNSQHSTNDKSHWESKAKGEATAQAGKIQKEWGACNNTDVRPQRKKHHRAKQSLQRGKTKGAAAWRSNAAKAQGFQYQCTVQGFEAVPGVTWWPGFIIPVYDYKYDVSAELLIVDVKFHRAWGGGSTTELTLTHKDAYSDKCGGTSPKDGRTSSFGQGAPETQAEAPLDIEQEDE